jgi:uncharacterized protein
MTQSSELQAKLKTAFHNKGPDYSARTRHLDKDNQPLFINRLILENSPYLLQHAHNPVDWFPWGSEAFRSANEQNRPIFLSIGYATCHWCHVMEEQSFESKTVADFLNTHFICIKVDREQHPDIDSTYMTAVTIFAGHGGWPMSSFLTPEGKPFFAGTYYPQAGFLDLLTRINQAWQEQQSVLVQQAEQLADAVERSNLRQQSISKLTPHLVTDAIESALSNYDSHFGGFSNAPKFPHEPLLLLMLQSLQRQNDSRLTPAVQHTLNAMAQGGIYDQIGGGFHRYAVDKHWLVPHFEKMLYNQAYLSRVYLQAYLLYRNPLYKRIVIQILDYVLREMRNTDGLFWSATDADSEGHEGTYFVWSLKEIEQILSEDDAQFIIDLYGITDKGNFEGHNILYLPDSLDAFAAKHSLSLNVLCERVDQLRGQLLEYREQRIPPLTDDKILTAWNGMLITALAEAGRELAISEYVVAADAAVSTLWRFQRIKPGELWRVRLGQQGSVAARQEDYAHFAEALLAVYDANDNLDYLEKAEQLTSEMLDTFLNPSSGMLEMGNEALLFTQPSDSYDGAQPSGNAVAVRILNRLCRRTGKQAFHDQAVKILQAHSGNIARQPLGYAYMLAQWDELSQGEVGSLQYAGCGNIRIKLHSTHPNNDEIGFSIHLDFNKGWYLNEKPIVTMPDSEQELNIALKDEKGETELLFNIDRASFNEIPYYLTLQIHPCSEQECLPAETIRLFTSRLERKP